MAEITKKKFALMKVTGEPSLVVAKSSCILSKKNELFRFNLEQVIRLNNLSSKAANKRKKTYNAMILLFHDDEGELLQLKTRYEEATITLEEITALQDSTEAQEEIFNDNQVNNDNQETEIRKSQRERKKKKHPGESDDDSVKEPSEPKAAKGKAKKQNKEEKAASYQNILENISSSREQMELHLQQEKQNQSARCEASKKSTLVQKGDCAATVNIESISEKDQPPAAIAKEGNGVNKGDDGILVPEKDIVHNKVSPQSSKEPSPVASTSKVVQTNKTVKSWKGNTKPAAVLNKDLHPQELQLAKVSVDQSSNAGSEDGMSKSSEEKSSPSDSDMEAEASKGSKGKSLKKIAITTEPVREISEDEDSDSEMLEKVVVPSTKSVSVREWSRKRERILRQMAAIDKQLKIDVKDPVESDSDSVEFANKRIRKSTCDNEGVVLSAWPIKDAFSERCFREASSCQQFINKLMSGLFTKEYLLSHTRTGSIRKNSNDLKEPMDPKHVEEIIDVARKFYGFETPSNMRDAKIADCITKKLNNYR